MIRSIVFSRSQPSILTLRHRFSCLVDKEIQRRLFASGSSIVGDNRDDRRESDRQAFLNELLMVSVIASGGMTSIHQLFSNFDRNVFFYLVGR